MIDPCPTCLGFIFFRKFKLLLKTTPRFWLMQMDLCLDLELSMGNYLRICLAEVWSQREEILSH